MSVHEFRFAVRSLTKSWGFTVLAVASLGLGLGANTALFSLVDALLLRSLPAADPASLVLIQRPTPNGKPTPLDATSLEVIRGLTNVYADAALTTALPSAAVAIDNAPEPSRQVFASTPSFFTTLGVTAEVGRLETTRATSAAVISDRYWRARFAADRSVIGRAIAVNGAVVTILAARQLDHVIAGLLIGLRPFDWMMVAAATAAMVLVAILAALLPALRAARTDPLITMRTN